MNEQVTNKPPCVQPDTNLIRPGSERCIQAGGPILNTIDNATLFDPQALPAPCLNCQHVNPKNKAANRFRRISKTL